MDIDTILDQTAPAPAQGIAMTIPVAQIAARPLKPVRVFHVWPLLQLQRDLWQDAGFDTHALTQIHAQKAPKNTLLGRIDDSPGGCAYMTLQGDICAIHMGMVVPQHRRKGMGQWLLIGAAHWAQDHGATTLALRCPPSARAFCDAMGMAPAQ